MSKRQPLLVICDAGAPSCRYHGECPHRRVHPGIENCKAHCYNKKGCRAATDADIVMDKLTEVDDD